TTIHTYLYLVPYTTLYRSRQHDGPEDPQAAGAVDEGGLFEFVGDLVEELLEDEHHGGGDHLRQDDAPVGVDQVQRQHQLEQRDRSEEHTSELQSRFDLVCR